MTGIKYVIIDEIKPVLFSECHVHRDFNGFPSPPGGEKITSAGFVSIREIDTPEESRLCTVRMLKSHCFGESTSLKMKPGPNDEWLIDKMLNA